MDAPLVSVVIASHRPDYIGELLSALRLCAPSAPVSGPAFETIAVCDYQPGPLKETYPEVFFHTVKNRSISAKRNFGIGKAIAGIIAFIDDDCTPSNDWVARGYGFLAAHDECAAVEGLTTIENTGPLPALRDYHRLERPGFRTNNIFYRKRVFLQVGGFDERFTVQREDIDLAFSVLDKGHTIGHSADIRVTHRVRRGEPWDLLKNCVNRRFDPLLFKKHPSRYREHIKSPFPLTLLLLLGFHCATLGSFFIGTPFFAAAGLIDAAAVTVLTMRRGGAGPLRDFAAEWLSSLCAPLVLSGALLYGAVRYRKLLLV